MNNLIIISKNISKWIIEQRRYLHKHAEFSLCEFNTAKYCKNIFIGLGYKINTGWGEGFTADIDIPGVKKRIAFRADMDALPIMEKSGDSFASINQNVSHVCGHDTHMAIALGTAKIIAENSKPLKKNIRFIFQPSEELLPGGAKGMIESGCLVGVDEIYGLHNDPGTEIGKIRTKVGPLMATGDKFSLQIKGKGCHGARPQDGLDPIIAGTELITHWQTIISRRINPLHASVISIGKINAGTEFNIIPEKIDIVGTVRVFCEEDGKKIENLMKLSAELYTKYGYKIDFIYEHGYPVVVNHERCVKNIIKAAESILGKNNVSDSAEAVGWGEDFAYYLKKIPGAFFFLGSGNSKLGIVAPLHSPYFRVDENCLALGSAVMAQIAFDE